MNNAIQTIRTYIRKNIGLIAKLLDRATSGKLTPNMITTLSLVGHIYIAYLIAQDSLTSAALWLIFFGLMDTLDGELARLQNSQTQFGMVYDATSDRIKETLIYAAIAYYFAQLGQSVYAFISTLVLGISISISYVKAKGEAALATSTQVKQSNINKIFATGLASFEVRMAVIVLGLFLNRLDFALIILTIINIQTLLGRVDSVSQSLATNHHDKD